MKTFPLEEASISLIEASMFKPNGAYMDLICWVQTSHCKSGQDLVAAFSCCDLASHWVGLALPIWWSQIFLHVLFVLELRAPRLATGDSCSLSAPSRPRCPGGVAESIPEIGGVQGSVPWIVRGYPLGTLLTRGAPQHPHPSPPRNYKFGLLVGFAQKIHEKAQNAQDFVNPLFLSECTENAFSNLRHI